MVGLKCDRNLGDQVIFQMSRYYLVGVLKELGAEDVEIREMDMMGRDAPGRNLIREEFRKDFLFKLLRFSRRFYQGAAEKAEDYLQKITTEECCGRYIDENTIAVIFAGGGLIKYRVQTLYINIDVITRFAEKYGVPVMFSAVGVEGYDRDDYRCRMLVNAVKRKNVRFISTRDDIETLRNHYSTESQITALAADPACGAAAVFPPAEKQDRAVKTIGLGIARKDIFRDYGVAFTEEQALALWSSLYEMLTGRDYRCTVFCNGAVSDYSFINEWADHMGFSPEMREAMIMNRPESSEELTEIITSCDGIIATRLHTAILAYAYSIPSVSLVWNDKQLFFGRQIGAPERFITFDGFDCGHIVETLESAMENPRTNSDREKYISTTKEAIRDFLEPVVSN
ncbi:MAG: polysaccharide pyruvyl transferase family protein [Oscillospiraceae bacterium]|nr:polysaccharide pyruvyl transferase family protein [Oscillospiraceae bacterium]